MAKPAQENEFTEPGLMSAKMLADLLNVDRHTVADWASEGCPVVQRASREKGQSWIFRLSDVVGWLRERDLEEATGEGPDGGMHPLKAEKLRVEIAHRRLRFEKEKGGLVEVSDVAALVATEYQAIRSAFINLGPNLAPHLVGKKDSAEIRDIISKAVDRALDSLAADKMASPTLSAREEATAGLDDDAED